MKKKLYRIGNSKEPTPQQMLNMAVNLRSVYERHCAVMIDADAYKKSEKLDYKIYVAGLNPSHRRTESWPELITAYRRLMKEAKSV